MAYLTFPNLERSGRLGNQLWQIASTIGLARRHGMEPRFPTSWSYRPWFNIPGELFSDVVGTPAQTLGEDLAHMDWRTRVYLQDLSFIADVEAEVRSYFQPTMTAWGELGSATPLTMRRPILVLHVRRGDNLTAQHCYPVPSLGYYLDAVHRHLDHDVMIYGDDPEWNLEVLRPQAAAITSGTVLAVEGTPRPKEHEPDYMTAPILDWRDLFWMSWGEAFCLSNSTLGWWAAWLSGSDDVCYPDPWFGPELDIAQHGYIDGSLMMPPTWQRVVANGVALVPCRQDHVHTDICRTVGDGPVYTPRRTQYPTGGSPT